MTVSLFGHAAPLPAPDKRVFRSAVTGRVTAATSAIKEGCKVAFALAGLLTVMIALAALRVVFFGHSCICVAELCGDNAKGNSTHGQRRSVSVPRT
jgi:hypothetical protein